MKVSSKAIELIKKFEGYMSKPYLCSGNKWTIGYGSTQWFDGKPVTPNTREVTLDEAVMLLTSDVQFFSKGVLKNVKVPINQNQFDALVCFAYNVGLGNLAKSTLLKKVNANPNDKTIRDEFVRWNKAGGKVLLGLTRRRVAESNLYFQV